MNLNSKKITAILGPTNTGKTHLAVDTMLEYETGIIGFPLRLLAREIFDKCVLKVGVEKVALITGEEKIIPSKAKYFICTVESMPKNLSAEFIAVDEIQMCTDHERGHIFTDRLLNFRGEKLTMFLGSHTMARLIKDLIPDIEFVSRQRYSKLTYGGYKKISRLNPKTAIIAFSIEEVYAIAELIRRQKGGTAIIMGSLSPRTRNSQVNLYQSGDADFLVATDAIGMGINMNIDTISFSNFNKFDGKKTRKLNLSEISQIAGRAGRHINDGTFGITGQCTNMSAEDVEKIETHQLEEISEIYWRNSNLNFESFEGFISSIEKKPSDVFLRKVNECVDEKSFKFMVKNKNDFNIENKKEVIKILWECCQIPDFAKKTYGQHIEVIKKVFSFLAFGNGKVSNLYMKDQLKNLEKYSGNIDVIANRISNVRTWSYVANKKNWVENQDYWIERTKNIEDKLSDKLHEELTKSFVDKRISILSRSLKQDITLGTEITSKDEVIIDGQFIGKLAGLKLNLDFKSGSLDADLKSLKKAARQAISPELMRRVSKILKSDLLKLDTDHKIYWMNYPIANISPGKDYLNPKINLIVDEAIDAESKEKLQFFLQNWIDVLIKKELSDLVNLNSKDLKNSYARALCFRLFENNGIIKRDLIDQITKNLTQEDRISLRKKGVKIGRYHIFLPKMLKPKAVELRVILWKTFFQDNKQSILPRFGLNFLKNESKNSKKFLLICGFENFSNYYIRIDILEKLFLKIIKISKNGKFILNSDMINLVGCTKENFTKLLILMNYKKENNKGNKDISFIYSPKQNKTYKSKINEKYKKNNPFKILSEVRFK